MIVHRDFTHVQRLLIRNICTEQLESLNRLLNNESLADIDVDAYLHEWDITKEEFEEQLIKNIRKFKKVAKDPDDLRVLHEGDLSIFRHILFHVEDRYKEKYPNAVSNLWRRLFLIEHVMETQFDFNQLN